ncbi:MAG: hypothetical protein JNL98_04855 [Bryobacterales bacterium]|nr:hypothetical protein [Bryobacterales bacterium]
MNTLKTVLMPAIPGHLQWGRRVSSDLSYLRYGAASWRWWCGRHGVRFHLLDRRPPGFETIGLPPTVLRWAAACDLLEQDPHGMQLAVVDADTMIRWDAPDLFEAASGQLAAVRDGCAEWVAASIRAYQPLFPRVHLAPERYFNAGVVILNGRHLPALRLFLDFWLAHASELRAIQESGDYGSDQTPLNFALTQSGTAVRLIDHGFNRIHCVPADLAWRIERCLGDGDSGKAAAELADASPLDLTGEGHIWHFTNVWKSKPMVMRQVWSQIESNYPETRIQ